MPDEIEVPTEHLHETLHEQAHGHGHGAGEGPPAWVSQVALSAAVIAVLAAIAALLAGHHANEAMIEQMRATDQWAYYQAKGIKSSLVETKIELVTLLGKEPREDDRKKVEEYKKDQKETKEKADELERSSEEHMHRHVGLSRSVTMLQVAIALSAISVLSRKKIVWFGSLVIGAVAAVFFVQSLL